MSITYGENVPLVFSRSNSRIRYFRQNKKYLCTPVFRPSVSTQSIFVKEEYCGWQNWAAAEVVCSWNCPCCCVWSLRLRVDLGAWKQGKCVLATSTVVHRNRVVSSYVNGIFNIIFRLQADTVSKMWQPERTQIENPFQVTASLARGREAVLDFFDIINTDFRT